MDYSSPTRTVRLAGIPTLRRSPSTPPRVIDVRLRPNLPAQPAPPVPIRPRVRSKPNIEQPPQPQPRMRPCTRPKTQLEQQIHSQQQQPMMQPQPQLRPQPQLQPHNQLQQQPQQQLHPEPQIQPQPMPQMQLPFQSHMQPYVQIHPQPQVQPHSQPISQPQPQGSTKRLYQEDRSLSIPLVEDIHRDLKNLTKLLLHHMQIESPRRSPIIPATTSKMTASAQDEDSLADMSMSSRDYLKKHNLF